MVVKVWAVCCRILQMSKLVLAGRSTTEQTISGSSARNTCSISRISTMSSLTSRMPLWQVKAWSLMGNYMENGMCCHGRSVAYALLYDMGRVKRIWYLSPMRAAKVQASLRIRAVSPEPLLLAHTSSELRGTFRQKARSLAPLNGWACAVEICHDGMLEDTNSLDGAHI